MSTIEFSKNTGVFLMANFLKLFTKRDFKMLAMGAGLTAIFFIFWLIFTTSSLVNSKTPKIEPLQPSTEMVQFFGKPNILAQKYPLSIWQINNQELMTKVKEAFEQGKLTLGANNKFLKLGDYLMFNSNNSNIWGYVEDKAQIENTYTIVKE